MKKFISLLIIASMLFCFSFLFLSSCSEPTKWKVTFDFNGDMVRATYKCGNTLTETWYSSSSMDWNYDTYNKPKSKDPTYFYVEDGEYLSDPGAPKKASSFDHSFTRVPITVFSGWYLDKACTQPFDFNQPIHNNLTLYAGWVILEPVDFSTGRTVS